jgi:hypothetical protein
MENLILNKGDYSSSHQEAKFKMDKKPDFENESLRMWVPDKKEKKRLKKKTPCIKYRGYVFGLVGFTLVKKNNKVVFAYKFKHESKMVIAYLDDDNKEIQAVYNDLKKYAKAIGYEFRDVHEVWDKILMEEHTIKKLTEKADREGQLSLLGGD